MCTAISRSLIEDAGSKLFIDLVVNTYGVADGLDQTHEPSMPLVNHEFHGEKGFILSPFINSPRVIRFLEGGPGELARSSQGLIGILDEDCGRTGWPRLSG